MTDKLKDLLSPERLRARWQGAADPGAAASVEVEQPAGGLLETYTRVVQRFQERFPGAQGAFAAPVLAALKTDVDRLLYGDDGAGPAGDDGDAAGEILRRLRTLEDLLDCQLAVPSPDA